MRILTVIILAFTACQLHAVESLCRSNEISYFSCKIRDSNKFVSVCGNEFSQYNPARESEDPWIEYLFGNRDKLELIYPNRHRTPSEAFHSDFHIHPEGANYWLSFNIGVHEYAVVYCLACQGEVTGAMVVSRNGAKTKTKHYLCEDEPIMESGQNSKGNFKDLVIDIYQKP